MAESSLDQQLLIDESAWWASPAAWVGVLVVLVLVVGGTVAYYWSQAKEAEKNLAAQVAYNQAVTPEEKLVVARAHADSPAAVVWLEDVGNTFYLQNKYDLSAQAYGLVLQKQPNSPLASGALLGQAEALLAADKSEEGLKLITQLLQDKTKSAYQPLARILLAHWQIAHNKVPEARQTLTDLQVQSPGNAFSEEATEMLSTLPK
jgi:predicted negative regulator of RcsB-dependent stress response